MNLRTIRISLKECVPGDHSWGGVVGDGGGEEEENCLKTTNIGLLGLGLEMP